MKDLMLMAALQFSKSGLSVVKANPANKRPMSKWKEYQGQRATEGVLRGWFSHNGTGIGIIPGAVSGNLEVLDHDCKELWDAYCQVVAMDAPDLLAMLPIVQTQRANHHVFYRCDDIEGNLKLARRQNGVGWDTLIETRGEGGFVVTAPSAGYRMLQGKLTNIPTITAAQRRILLNAARAFDEMGIEETEARPPGPATNGDRPGDDFNQRGDGLGILLGNGWADIYRASIEGRQVHYLRRPGKRDGWSATYNYIPNRLFVFSSNAGPFEAERVYGPFAILAMLDHAGDYSAAAKALAVQGYGQRAATGAPGEDEVEGIDIPDQYFRCTDCGNGKRFVRQYGESVRYSYNLGRWFFWNGKQWAPDDMASIEWLAKTTAQSIRREAADSDNEDLQKAMERWSKQSENKSRIGSMLFMARSEPRIPIRPSDLDADPWLFNTDNGIVDLRTGTMGEHDPEKLITKITTVNFRPDAKCPLWLSFLDRVMAGNQDIISFLQRAIGYSLTGTTREQCLFILYGTGANGKSTMVDTVGAVLNDYAMNTPTQTLMLKSSGIPNDVARLKGARFVTASESDDGQRLAESLIKQMTGGDRLTARFLNAEFFDFVPTFKIWLSTNHKPEVIGTDQAIWRRIHMIPFDVTIPPAEQDKDLLIKLQAEHEGILAWAVRGCLDWMTQGLNPPAEVKKTTAQYRASMDILLGFIEDCCVQENNVTTTVQAMYNAYKLWCDESNEPSETKRKFCTRMRERGFTIGRGAGNVAIFDGVGLRDTFSQRTMEM